MSTIEEQVESAIAEYNVADAQIAAWAEEYAPLNITDVESKAQFAAVREARMTVKAARVEVEKTRKRLKADALEYGRRVDGEAKRITALIEPIEQRLYDEEQKVAEHKRQKEEEALRVRLDALHATQPSTIDVQAVKAMSEEEFASHLAACTEQHEARKAIEKAEVEKRQVEEIARKAEQEKLDRERAELDKLREAQEKELAEQRAALEAERAAIEAEQRKKREAEEQAEAKRLAAERAPDVEKVRAFASAIRNVEVPDVWCDVELDQLVADTVKAIGALIAGQERRRR